MRNLTHVFTPGHTHTDELMLRYGIALKVNPDHTMHFVDYDVSKRGEPVWYMHNRKTMECEQVQYKPGEAQSGKVADRARVEEYLADLDRHNGLGCPGLAADIRRAVYGTEPAN